MERDSPYRWIIAAVSALFLALVMGLCVNGLSVYFVPLEQAQGWDRGEIAAINSAGLLGLATGGLTLAWLAERFGTRRMALAGVAVFSAVLLAASRATALWQLYCAFFLGGLVAGGAINAPLLALVSNWFTRGAGVAIGLVTAGQALGQGGVPFLGALLIDAFGWRGAMMAQGLITVGLLMPLGLLLRPAPVLSGAAPAGARIETPDSSEALDWRRVLLIGSASLMCCVCMAVPLMHLVPLVQICGYSAPQAGGLMFFMLAVALLGRLFFGWLADRIGSLPAWMIASAWQTTLIVGFTYMNTLESFYIFAAVYGFGYGGVMTGVLTTTRDLTDPKVRARATGLVMAFAFAGHGLGGYEGGLFYDLTGTYGLSYASGAVAGMFNLALLATLFALTSGRGPRQAAAA